MSAYFDQRASGTLVAEALNLAPGALHSRHHGLHITGPVSKSLSQGVATAITGVSISRAGAASTALFTVKITDTKGLLGATGTGVTGAGTKALTITGSLAQVNAALATLTDTAATVGSDSIKLTATDTIGDAAASRSISIATAGKPSITAPASEVFGQGKIAAIAGVAVKESGARVGESFTVTLSDTAGLLTATGSGVTGSGTTSLTIKGSLSSVNSVLATLKDTAAAAGADTLKISVTDSLGGTATPASVAVSVNGLPTFADPAAVVLGQGQAGPVAGVTLSESGVTTGETFTVKITDTNGLLSATGAGVSGSGTNSLTLTGALSDVNAALATLKDTEATTAADTITLSATDSLGNSAVQGAIAVSVNPPPSISAPAAAVFGQGQTAAIGGVSVAESGQTGGETFTATVSDASGVISATGAGVSGAGTSTLTITGSLADVNTALASLTVSEAAAGTDTLTVSATDGFGNSAPQASVALTANGLPTYAAPAATVVGKGQTGAIAGVSLAESGVTAGETFTAVLTDTAGLLSATGAGVSGSGTTSLTLTGTLDAVNAALATLTVSEAAAGADSIVLTASDNLGNQAAKASIGVTANGAPVVKGPSLAIVGQGQPGAIANVSLFESGDTSVETFTVTVSDTKGLLSATGPAVSGAGTTSLTITGSLADINAALASLTDSEAAAGTDTLTLAASDSLGNAAAGGTIALTIDGPPTITAAKTRITGQGQATLVKGITVNETGVHIGETFTATVSDTKGTLSATGAGVSGSGTTTLTLTGTKAQVNAALATLTDLEAAAGNDTLTVNVSDSFGNSAPATSVAIITDGPPAVYAPKTKIIGQGKTTAITGLRITESGLHIGETFTVTLSDAKGKLTATGTGISGSGSTKLTITGTIAAVNTALTTVKINEAAAGADTITFNAKDSFGNSAPAKSVAIITDGPPAVYAPKTKIIGQGKTTAIAGLRITESGFHYGETFTVTLSDTNGLLSATGTGVSGSGTTKLTFTGTIAAVNAALTTVKITEAAAGADTIAMTAKDSFGNSATPRSVAIITDGPPVVYAPKTKIIGQGKTTVITGLRITESGLHIGETFTVVLSDAKGKLTATGAGVSGSGTTKLTITGAIAAVNTALTTVKIDETTTGADTLTFTAKDSFGNSATPRSVAIITDGHPTITAPTALSLTSGVATAVAGVKIAEIGLHVGETFTVTLSDTKGLLSASGTGVSGSGTTKLTLTGTLAQVTSDLTGLKDTMAAAGTNSISISAVDSFGNAAVVKSVSVSAAAAALSSRVAVFAQMSVSSFASPAGLDAGAVAFAGQAHAATSLIAVAHAAHG